LTFSLGIHNLIVVTQVQRLEEFKESSNPPTLLPIIPLNRAMMINIDADRKGNMGRKSSLKPCSKVVMNSLKRQVPSMVKLTYDISGNLIEELLLFGYDTSSIVRYSYGGGKLIAVRTLGNDGAVRFTDSLVYDAQGLIGKGSYIAVWTGGADKRILNFTKYN
jgi:hypothetical protein